MDTSKIVTAPTGEPFKALTGICRSQQYILIGQGELDSVLMGRRRFIIMSSYDAYLDRLRQSQATTPRREPSNFTSAPAAPAPATPRRQRQRRVTKKDLRRAR